MPTVAAADWPYYSIKCWSRFRNAKSAWYKAHGVDQRNNHDLRVPEALRVCRSDWSFRVESERGYAPGLLARLGLPADWTPKAAPKALMDLPIYGEPSPAVVRLLKGE